MSSQVSNTERKKEEDSLRENVKTLDDLYTQYCYTGMNGIKNVTIYALEEQGILTKDTITKYYHAVIGCGNAANYNKPFLTFLQDPSNVSDDLPGQPRKTVYQKTAITMVSDWLIAELEKNPKILKDKLSKFMINRAHIAGSSRDIDNIYAISIKYDTNTMHYYVPTKLLDALAEMNENTMKGGTRKKKSPAAKPAYVKTNRTHASKDGTRRVIYSKGGRDYVKRKDAKTGKFAFRPVNQKKKNK